MQNQSTPTGFEPFRAEPNDVLVYHLTQSVTVSMTSSMALEDPRVTDTSSTSSPGRVAATPTLGINRRAAEAPGLTDPGVCGIPGCLSLLRKTALNACGEPCDSHSLWEHDVTLSLMSTPQQDTNSIGLNGNASTARGFKSLRAEPNGFRIQLLSRSDTVSLVRARILHILHDRCAYLGQKHNPEPK